MVLAEVELLRFRLLGRLDLDWLLIVMLGHEMMVNLVVQPLGCLRYPRIKLVVVGILLVT